MNQKNLFILAGNASYCNRGCEAIIRGTTETIRHHFAEPEFLAISFFQNEDDFKAQAEHEYDNFITHRQAIRKHKKIFPYRFSRDSFRFSISIRRASLIYEKMLPYLEQSRAVLSVGGDNYSLDWRKPRKFTMLDDIVLVHKKPLIIWGASIGPFSKMPDYERYMLRHLRKVTGIFVRETVSLEYLAQNGVKDNVRLVADPAFLLKPVEPIMPGEIEKGAIGINLSPLLARYITDGNYPRWVALAAQIIREIHRATGRKIYLIPHDTRGSRETTNDYLTLKNVLSLLDGVDVVLVEDNYNAAETKWIISQMTAFAGAKTHSTIAAMSACVPTLSFVYSVKAKGINRDIFGDERYCISKEDCRPGALAERMRSIIDDAPAIKKDLNEVIPKFVSRALSAGQQLKSICE